MDDWKGEHLIRGVARQVDADRSATMKIVAKKQRAKRMAHRGRGRPKGEPKPLRLCAVPGCDALLSSGNTSGVCRPHNHTDQCRCKACINRGRNHVDG